MHSCHFQHAITPIAWQRAWQILQRFLFPLAARLSSFAWHRWCWSSGACRRTRCTAPLFLSLPAARTSGAQEPRACVLQAPARWSWSLPGLWVLCCSVSHARHVLGLAMQIVLCPVRRAEWLRAFFTSPALAAALPTSNRLAANALGRRRTTTGTAAYLSKHGLKLH